MTDLIRAFWDGKPLDVEYLRCARCDGPVVASEAVAVIDANQWGGWSHPDGCPGEDE